MPPTTHSWRDDMKAGEYVDEDGEPIDLGDDTDVSPIEERKELRVQKRPQDEVDGLGEREIEFIASTPEEDRDGDIIEQSGIKLGPFKENPVFLYAHRQGMPPVGKVTKSEIRGGQMIARVKFLGPEDVGEFAADHEHVQFAEMLYRLYKGGFMSAVSIGFIAQPDEVEERDDGGFRFKQIEVMELSAVSVQSNRGAVAVQRALQSDEGDGIRKIVKDVASTHDIDFTKGVDADGTEGEQATDKSTETTDGPTPKAKESRTLSKANERRAIEIITKGAKMMMDHDEDRAMDVLDSLRRGTHPMEGEDMMDDDKSTDGGASIGTLEAKLTADTTEYVEGLEGAKEALDDVRDVMQEVNALCDEMEGKAPEVININASGASIGDSQKVADAVANAVDAGSPDLPVKSFETKEVTDYRDLALAPRDREWDSDAAVGRWREFTDSANEPADNYKDNFIWYDADDQGDFTAYKLPYGDVVDGNHIAVPRGVFAVAAALEGARGGVDIPESDIDDAKSHVESYYAKMRDEFDDDNIIAPWRSEDSMRVWLAKQADALGIDEAPSTWLEAKVAPPLPDEGGDTDTDKAPEADETPENGDGPDDGTDAKAQEGEQTDDADTPAFRLRRTDDELNDEPTCEQDSDADAPSGGPRIRLNS